MNEDEEIAVIVGVVVGSLVVVIIISVSVYCYCGKRGKKNALEKLMSQRNGSHLARPTPITFDNSSYSKSPPLFPAMKYIDHGLGSLPKVGSSGLWLTRTSMLAPTNHQARGKPQDIPHSVLLRATSEPRLAGDLQTMYDSNMRVYQSQQMPPLFETYEPWQDYGERFPETHYTAAVLRDPYLPEPGMFERNALRRTVSDATTPVVQAPIPSSRRISSPPPLPRPHSRPKPYRAFAHVHQRDNKSHHARPAGYPPSRPGAERRHNCHDRLLSYNDNFIFRATPGQPVRNDLDRGYNSSLDVTGERKRSDNRLHQSSLVGNHRHRHGYNHAHIVNAEINSKVHQNIDVHNPTGRTNEIVLIQNGGDQQGTQTTVTSGYDSTRSDFVNDVHLESRRHDPQIAPVDSPDVPDYYSHNDDLVNNNVLETRKHTPEYRIQPSSSDHTDIEAKHVMTTAFQFLDNYLSDDDASVIGSDLAGCNKDMAVA